MFGFSPDYNRGLQEQGIRDAHRHALDQRQDDAALAQWMRYARDLEARLAQSEAETKAARVQRNVIDNKLGETMAALRQANPKHPLCDELRVAADTRREIDQTLAQAGIALDRSGPTTRVIRTR